MTWVRLHLVPQTEGNSTMPPHIIGVLTQETPSAYVLMKVLEEVETDLGWTLQPKEGMDFINRTYVWRCEILPEPPQLDGMEDPYNGEGGLG